MNEVTNVLGFLNSPGNQVMTPSMRRSSKINNLRHLLTGIVSGEQTPTTKSPKNNKSQTSITINLNKQLGSNSDLQKVGGMQPRIPAMNEEITEDRKEDFGYDSEGRRESRLGKRVLNREERMFAAMSSNAATALPVHKPVRRSLSMGIQPNNFMFGANRN